MDWFFYILFLVVLGGAGYAIYKIWFDDDDNEDQQRGSSAGDESGGQPSDGGGQPSDGGGESSSGLTIETIIGISAVGLGVLIAAIYFVNEYRKRRNVTAVFESPADSAAQVVKGTAYTLVEPITDAMIKAVEEVEEAATGETNRYPNLSLESDTALRQSPNFKKNMEKKVPGKKFTYLDLYEKEFLNQDPNDDNRKLLLAALSIHATQGGKEDAIKQILGLIGLKDAESILRDMDELSSDEEEPKPTSGLKDAESILRDMAGLSSDEEEPKPTSVLKKDLVTTRRAYNSMASAYVKVAELNIARNDMVLSWNSKRPSEFPGAWTMDLGPIAAAWLEQGSFTATEEEYQKELDKIDKEKELWDSLFQRNVEILQKVPKTELDQVRYEEDGKILERRARAYEDVTEKLESKMKILRDLEYIASTYESDEVDINGEELDVVSIDIDKDPEIEMKEGLMKLFGNFFIPTDPPKLPAEDFVYIFDRTRKEVLSLRGQESAIRRTLYMVDDKYSIDPNAERNEERPTEIRFAKGTNPDRRKDVSETEYMQVTNFINQLTKDLAKNGEITFVDTESGVEVAERHVEDIYKAVKNNFKNIRKNDEDLKYDIRYFLDKVAGYQIDRGSKRGKGLLRDKPTLVYGL